MLTIKDLITEAKKNQFLAAVKQYAKEEEIPFENALEEVLSNGEYYFGEVFDYDNEENDELKGIISEYQNLKKFTRELNASPDCQLKKDIKETLAKL